METRFLSLINRLLPFVTTAREQLGDTGLQRVSGLYWILLLLGSLPAVRAELLFPTSWLAQLGDGLNLAGAENIFGPLAFLVAALVVVLAIVLQRAAHFWAALPWTLLGAISFAQAAPLGVLQNAYSLAAFLAFLHFIVAGRTRSFYFFVYIAGLAIAEHFDPLLTWDRITGFVAVSIVLSLLYETWRQNRPILRQLGRENSAGMFFRAAWLWSPTLLLIAAGLSVSHWITSAAEEMIYEGTFVNRHCEIPGSEPAVQLPCPDSGSRIEAAQIRFPPEAGEDCYYMPYWQASRPQRSGGLTIPPSTTRPESFICPDRSLAEAYEVEIENPETGLQTVTRYRYPVERLPFESSLDLSVKREFDVVNGRAQQALENVDQVALRQSRIAGSQARELFGVVPQSPGITIAPCEWYELECNIIAAVKRSLIRAYVRVRTRTETAFVNQVQQRADAIASGVSDSTEEVGDVLNAHIVQWRNATRDSIARVFTIYRVISVLAVLWMAVIALKSFLYVFGRVVFDRKTDVFVDLADDDTGLQQGAARVAHEITIPGDYPHDVYYKSNYQPLGPAPRFSIPQAFSAALSRIRNGTWSLSRITMPCDDDRGLTFNSVQADYLVDWEMREGEEIVFSYTNFVAMNENVQLRTIVSLRISSLLLGRFVFHSARCKGGAGRLILRTRGKPASAEQVRRSIPLSRLIAWNSFARFSVDSHLTHADIFLNGFNLRRNDAATGERPAGIVIVEADAREGSLLFGTLRFARHFLLPV